MPDRRQVLVAVGAATTPILAGCAGGYGGGGGEGETTTATATTATTTEQQRQQADETVVMQNTAFQPVKAEVETGATVGWENEDSFGHDVTSAAFHDVATAWDFEKTVGADESVARTFPEKGIYEYYCSIHGKSTMCGAIVVGDATLEKTLPCEDNDDGGGY